MVRLRHAEGLNFAEIARALNRDMSVVQNKLRPFEATTSVAGARLRANADLAVREWVKALPIAAGEGNHKPAKDLLTAVGVIQAEPVAQFAVQVNMPGVPAPDEIRLLYQTEGGESPEGKDETDP